MATENKGTSVGNKVVEMVSDEQRKKYIAEKVAAKRERFEKNLPEFMSELEAKFNDRTSKEGKINTIRIQLNLVTEKMNGLKEERKVLRAQLKSARDARKENRKGKVTENKKVTA